MTYNFKDEILNVFNNGKQGLIQPYDPATGKNFESEEEARTWFERYCVDFYGSDIIEADIDLTLIDGAIVELDAFGEYKIESDNVFSAVVQISKKISDVFCHLMVVSDKEEKIFEVEFIEGVASKNLMMSESGKYKIYVVCSFDDENGTRNSIIHKEKVFNIT